MTNRLLQPSLTAGELAPSLYARTDLARYQVGLRKCRNFIVRPYGGVENRAGLRFLSPVWDEAQLFRLIPFVFSTDVAYVVELGHYTARFYANDALVSLVNSDVNPWDSNRVYLVNDYVSHSGKIWRSKAGANDHHTPNISPTWWEDTAVLVLRTPYPASAIWDLRYTQSADVMYLVHESYPPLQLERQTATKFRTVNYKNLEGPFRDLNVDESLVVVASGVLGTVTLTANKSIFSAAVVGSQFYLEVKNLGQIKPWVVGDRSVTVGTRRRNEGKTYIATTVPSGGDWSETGNRAPIHEEGRAWDGASDSKTNGSQTWYSGVEWAYEDAGYGIVRIDEVLSPTQVSGEVIKRLPNFVVGTVPSASNTWNLVGDGTTKTFAIAGAGNGRYGVTIGSVPVQSDPNYIPPPPLGGGGGGDGNKNRNATTMLP